MTDGPLVKTVGNEQPLVAYFSMEIGIDPGMPTYAGGLGVLAGDTIRSAADLEIPMVAVTLLHRRGYFYQRLDEQGWQREEPVAWPINDFCHPIPQRVTVEVEGRTVHVGAWHIRTRGETGGEVPVYLLDTDLPDNEPWDRTLTDTLYGGDDRYRLCQEVVLGFGGYRLLRALGYNHIRRFHLNEGHAALLILAMLEEKSVSRSAEDRVPADLIDAVREQCVFTTHTPVPAGHDQFPPDLARRVLGDRRCAWLEACNQNHGLNMTQLALRGSRFVNGVAMKHGEVSNSLFPGYPIHSITNGVHAVTWAAPPLQALFDRRLPDWRRDQLSLRYAIGIPVREIWDAHVAAKRTLIDYVNREANAGFDRDVLTIGCARRATAYKRSILIFHDMERLVSIAEQVGPIQIVFGGKAHPRDHDGKHLIRRIHEIRQALRGKIPVVYLPNYDMTLAKLICAGSDVWLNTPLPPMEASGTSGMKAAINGVPSLSVLDGWWIEGHVEDVTGWAIGEGESKKEPDQDLDAAHAAELYRKLEKKVLPLFYREPERFLEIMRHAIALNGGFFNTQRMVLQYLHKAYRLMGDYVRRG
ncbi:MAG: alpha-glucan family phosphorylase [Nitrospira sp.]|nr:alpha-glucan family phosphorylase [Nitrospira sp.]MCP9461556.1 alpha-glucan family phosphorylase [Nitrospira sp.]MCP9474731.1 alpha-glucan family phosphorylase [Nitrospira sp.]